MKRFINLFLIIIFFATSMCSCGNKKEDPEIFRGIRWNMTKEEVAEVEDFRDSVIMDVGSNDGRLRYTTSIGNCDNVIIVYTFDKNNVLTEFLISSGIGKSGTELSELLESEITKKYGEGSTEITSGLGMKYINTIWENENTKVEELIHQSGRSNTVYITFYDKSKIEG